MHYFQKDKKSESNLLNIFEKSHVVSLRYWQFMVMGKINKIKNIARMNKKHFYTSQFVFSEAAL